MIDPAPTDPRARELVRRLGLRPHPEGGFYREIFRSSLAIDPRDGRPERSALTLIYFILADGGHSRWHRVRSDEAWTWVEGDALELFRAAGVGDGALERVMLGAPGEDVEAAAVIPTGDWQAARTTGAFTLVTCAVGPGFDFADFEMLGDDADAADAFRRRHPEAAALV